MDILRNFKNIELSKREKILLYLLVFLILQFAVYILFFSKISEAIINSESKIVQLQNSIATERKIIENSKELEKQNYRMSADEVENIVSYADEDIISALKAKGIEVETLSETEKATHVEMIVAKNSIQEINKLSEYFTYDDFYALRTEEDAYKVVVNIEEEGSDTLLPVIVAKEEIDASIDLKREYFRDKLSENKNAGEEDKKSGEEKNKEKKPEEKPEIFENKEKDLNTNIEKHIEKIPTASILTDVSKPLYQSGELLPNESLNLKDLSLSRSDNGQLLTEGDSVVLNYELKNSQEEREFVILLGDIVDVDNLRVELELPEGFQGEIGYYDGYMIPFENFETEGETVIYSSQHIDGLQGLYYRINGGQSGQIRIKNIEGEI